MSKLLAAFTSFSGPKSQFPQVSSISWRNQNVSRPTKPVKPQLQFPTQSNPTFNHSAADANMSFTRKLFGQFQFITCQRCYRQKASDSSINLSCELSISRCVLKWKIFRWTHTKTLAISHTGDGWKNWIMCAVIGFFLEVCETFLHSSWEKLYKFIFLGKFPMKINLEEARSPYVHTKGKINFPLFILSVSCTKLHRRIIDNFRWQFSILQEFSENVISFTLNDVELVFLAWFDRNFQWQCPVT